MKHWSVMVVGLLVTALTAAGCVHRLPTQGWETLIDGETGLDNFVRQGDANWRAEGGAIVADKGKGGYLVTKKSYKDFHIYAEFYCESNTNSGIFIRASDPNKIGAVSAYEVNIWDTRPDPSYGTGGIVNVAMVNPMPKAGGKWNVYEIYARGSQLTVTLNGVVTANVQDSTHSSGPFALQFGAVDKGAPGGPIKWRKVAVKEL